MASRFVTFISTESNEKMHKFLDFTFPLVKLKIFLAEINILDTSTIVLLSSNYKSVTILFSPLNIKELLTWSELRDLTEKVLVI